jgi:MFS transporter, DHA1 family, multidrug resistance protein
MQVKSYVRAAAEALRDLRSRRWLLVICLAAFLTSAGMGLTNPILSLYAQGFGISTALVGFFITTYAIGRVLVTIPAGRAADRWGRKVPMVIGAILATLGSLALAMATEYTQLVLARLLQGIGSGIYMSAAFLVVADLSAPAERGKLASIFQGSILLGLTVSPSIGGLLADMIDIRAPLYGHAFLALIVAVLILGWFPKQWGQLNVAAPERDESADQDEEPPPQPDTMAAPVTRELLLDRNFLLIALSGFLIFVARAGSRDTLMPLIGNQELGLDTTALGLIFTLIALLNLVMIPLAGIVSDSLGRKPAVLLGLMLNALALFAIGMSSSYEWFLLGALLMGAGKGFGEPSSIVYVTDISPTGRYGTAFGLFLTMRDMGLFVGPLLLSWIADLGGLRLPFIVNGLAMVATAALFALVARETLHAITGPAPRPANGRD